MSRGIFFLVAGPAGVGKTTLLKELVAGESGVVKAISVTTRPPRSEEVDGQSYFFWDEDRFQKAVEAGEFLEHAVVHGNNYGTLHRFVREQLAAGVDVVKDIDVQGVELIRRLEAYRYPDSVAIFVLPPSKDVLLDRLNKRASENEHSMSTRLRAAEAELARVVEYDYAVVNDSVEHAVEKLKAIRIAEHCRRHVR